MSHNLTKSPARLQTGRVRVVIEAVEAGDGGAVHVEPPVAGEVLLVVESPWTGRLCAKLLTHLLTPPHTFPLTYGAQPGEARRVHAVSAAVVHLDRGNIKCHVNVSVCPLLCHYCVR